MKYLFPFTAISLLILSSIAHADVFERDWKIPGDGLLTFDDVNNREWLDLSETILDQFPGANLEENYQSVLAELNPGGSFEGFKVAKSNDATALAESAGIDASTIDFNTNHDVTTILIDLLSPTQILSTSKFGAVGALDEINEIRLFSAFGVNERSTGRSSAGLGIGRGIEGTLDQAGVMLYRHAIPEPATGILFFQSTFLWIGVKRRQSR